MLVPCRRVFEGTITASITRKSIKSVSCSFVPALQNLDSFHLSDAPPSSIAALKSPSSRPLYATRCAPTEPAPLLSGQIRELETFDIVEHSCTFYPNRRHSGVTSETCDIVFNPKERSNGIFT